MHHGHSRNTRSRKEANRFATRPQSEVDMIRALRNVAVGHKSHEALIARPDEGQVGNLMLRALAQVVRQIQAAEVDRL